MSEDKAFDAEQESQDAANTQAPAGTLTFEGVDYPISDLNESTLRILTALRDSDAAIARHRSEITLLTIARSTLVKDLRSTLDSNEGS